MLNLFIELAANTKNQFIISTHSPTFINDKTLNHVFRIYKDKDNISQQITIKDNPTFKIRDILHIINSTNNEKLFFADIVILVEGITDRLVFEKIIKSKTAESTRIIEIIEIKGKNNATKFQTFLGSINVPNFFISDLDYINEIGNQTIKSLFITNEKKIKNDVIKNPKSKDGEDLVEELEKAINENNLEDLKALWEYIKSFRRKIKPDITEEEEIILNTLLTQQEEKGNYILKLGDIEDYFPDEFKKKDLNNVIELLSDKHFKSWESTKEFKMLFDIIDKIFKASLL